MNLTTNEYFLKYYAGKNFGVRNNHKRISLKHIAEHAWAAGLPRAQVEIDCMMLGFGLCVAVPCITQRWQQMDAEYAQYQAEQEAQPQVNTQPLGF